MSKMNELYERVANDEALQVEVVEIVGNARAGNKEEIMSEFAAFAKRHGYDVTEREIGAFFEGMAQASAELSETELDSVAGGKSDTFSSFVELIGTCVAQSYVDLMKGQDRDC